MNGTEHPKLDALLGGGENNTAFFEDAGCLLEDACMELNRPPMAGGISLVVVSYPAMSLRVSLTFPALIWRLHPAIACASRNHRIRQQSPCTGE